jgi:hypothetical protein
LLIIEDRNWPYFDRPFRSGAWHLGDQANNFFNRASLDDGKSCEWDFELCKSAVYRFWYSCPCTYCSHRRFYGAHESTFSPQYLVLGKKIVLFSF